MGSKPHCWEVGWRRVCTAQGTWLHAGTDMGGKAGNAAFCYSGAGGGANESASSCLRDILVASCLGQHLWHAQRANAHAPSAGHQHLQEWQAECSRGGSDTRKEAQFKRAAQGCCPRHGAQHCAVPQQRALEGMRQPGRAARPALCMQRSAEVSCTRYDHSCSSVAGLRMRPCWAKQGEARRGWAGVSVDSVMHTWRPDIFGRTDTAG